MPCSVYSFECQTITISVFYFIHYIIDVFTNCKRTNIITLACIISLSFFTPIPSISSHIIPQTTTIYLYLFLRWTLFGRNLTAGKVTLGKDGVPQVHFQGRLTGWYVIRYQTYPVWVVSFYSLCSMYCITYPPTSEFSLLYRTNNF